MRPKLLDLFCGAGGASMGYYRVGFDVTGIDIKPQPRYPFRFIQGDALNPPVDLKAFDVIHASPPCQGYSALIHLPWLKDKNYPLLLPPVLSLLRESGKVYVVENVERSPIKGIVLCGRYFNLPIYRHRVFESNLILLAPSHKSHDVIIGHGRNINNRRKGTLNNGSAKDVNNLFTVAGGQCRKKDAERALDINWMRKSDLMQAIPPAYTEFIGKQLMNHLSHKV